MSIIARGKNRSVFVADRVRVFAFFNLLVCLDKANQQTKERCCRLVVG